ncbi:MAG: phage protease [Desulfovibrio sp.]|nr:phage protease [Desulfovibrio sp.]
MKWIEIARTGTFTDSSGRLQTFTESDLSEIAQSYNPDKRDCPLVFGHPKTDSAPAFGWMSAIKAENGKLLAQFASVPDAVREVVAKGHYKHVSMSLMPDRVTLRHVALLGAAQPAIDGLKAIELRHADDFITVDFSTQQGTDAMTEQELQRKIGQLEEQIKALQTENASLKSQAKTQKESQEKIEGDKKAAEAKAEKAVAEFAAYRQKVEGDKREARVSELVKAGMVTPAEKQSVLDFAAKLAARPEDTVDFASPDGSRQTVTLEERYFRELEARNPDGRTINFSIPPAHAMDRNEQPFNPDELAAKL